MLLWFWRKRQKIKLRILLWLKDEIGVVKDSNVWCIVQYIPSGFAVIQVAVVVKIFFIFCNMSATSLGDRTVVHMCIYTTTVIAAVTKPKRLRKPYSCAQPEMWLRGGTPDSLYTGSERTGDRGFAALLHLL